MTQRRNVRMAIEELRSLVRESGLTQCELAERARMSQSTVSDWLRGADTSLTRAERIAHAVGARIMFATARGD